MMKDVEPQDFLRDARDHAWDWFALHANQRMQTLNFFLISAAFLMAAYGALVDRNRWAAVVIAVIGAWVTFWFNRLDARTKGLIKAGERALQACEQQLAQLSQVSELEIVRSVEQSERLVPKYSMVFNCIELSVGIAFVAGALYAAFGVK